MAVKLCWSVNVNHVVSVAIKENSAEVGKFGCCSQYVDHMHCRLGGAVV